PVPVNVTDSPTLHVLPGACVQPLDGPRYAMKTLPAFIVRHVDPAVVTTSVFVTVVVAMLLVTAKLIVYVPVWVKIGVKVLPVFDEKLAAAGPVTLQRYDHPSEVWLTFDSDPAV